MIFFSRLSVCPPADTSTNLNDALMKAENETLDKDTKDLLIKLSAEIMEDVEYSKVIAEQTSLKEENSFKNLYFGQTELVLPHTDTEYGRTYMRLEPLP